MKKLGYPIYFEEITGSLPECHLTHSYNAIFWVGGMPFDVVDDIKKLCQHKE